MSVKAELANALVEMNVPITVIGEAGLVDRYQARFGIANIGSVSRQNGARPPLASD